MIYTLFFMVLFTCIGLCAFKFKWGFSFFVLSFFMYPRVFALGIGSEGFALTMQRAQLTIIAVFALIRLIISRSDRKYLTAQIARYPWVFNLVFLLWIAKVFASLVVASLKSDVLSGLSDDFFFTVMLLVASTLAIRSLEDISRIAKLISICIIVNGIVALIEIKLGHTVFAGVKVLYNTAANKDITEARLKGGAQRAQALMDSSLVFGYAAVLAFILANSAKKLFDLKNNKVHYLALLFCWVAVYFTRSRAALGMVAGMYTVLLFYYNINKITRKYHIQFVILVMLAASFLFMIVFVFDPLFTYINELQTGNALDIAQDSSAKERFDQLFAIVRTNGLHLLFGFGRLRYMPSIVPDEIINNQDNFFIRLFLESGMVGMLIHLVYILHLIFFSIRNFRLSFKIKNKGLTSSYFIMALYAAAVLVILNLTSSIIFNFFSITLGVFLIVERNVLNQLRYQKMIAEAELYNAPKLELIHAQ